jgi:hypothetical protein
MSSDYEFHDSKIFSDFPEILQTTLPHEEAKADIPPEEDVEDRRRSASRSSKIQTSIVKARPSFKGRLTHLNGKAGDGPQMLRAHKDVTNSEEKIKLLQARINVLERKEDQAWKRMHAMEVRAGYIEAAKVKQVNGISVSIKKQLTLQIS